MSSREYPQTPLLGVSVLVRRAGRILLVQRAREPLAGLWSLPGGLVVTGERLAAAAAREVREETALDITDLDQIGIEEVIEEDDNGRTRLHFVLAVFAATCGSGQLVPGDDAADARWCAPANPDGLRLTDGTARWLKAESER